MINAIVFDDGSKSCQLILHHDDIWSGDLGVSFVLKGHDGDVLNGHLTGLRVFGSWH